MLLYVMRHGPAQNRAPSGYDSERMLSVEGREMALRAARELSVRGSSGIVRIVSSPLVRARETAEIMRGVVCPLGRVDVRRELLPEDTAPTMLVSEMVALGGDSLMVGHQPSLERLMDVLVEGGAELLPRGFRTAMIVALEAIGTIPAGGLPRGRFRLRMILDPRLPSA